MTAACSHCGNTMALPVTAIPIVLKMALHSGDITSDAIEKIMAQWKEQRISDPRSDILEILKNHTGMTVDKIKKLDKARSIWLQRNREKRLAAAILHLQWIQQPTLDQALEIQKTIFRTKGISPPLGDILVQQGHLRAQQLEAVLNALSKCDQPSPKPSADSLPDASTSPPATDPVCEEPTLNPAPQTIIHQENQTESTPASELDAFLRLQISDNAMEAFIQAVHPLPAATSAEDIFLWVQAKGVVTGLVDISLVDGFIRFENIRQSQFKIATGKIPREGKDGRVTFHFPSDFLSSGAMLSDDGRIDFRERGTIPHVPQGSLLAEKQPAVKGSNGVDVFGHLIMVPEVKDPVIKAGTGVYTSDDKLKIYAKIDGQPTLRASGEISVMDEILVKGDVGYETGHIQYQGKVRITGKIPAGFRVEAFHVTAESLDGGIIAAKGDVIITNGITEGEVQTEGDVRARFINKSKIRTLANVTVASEIIDADIACSGGCNIRSGKIIASTIAARQGIEAGSIGTEISDPSTLYIGVDLPLQEGLDQIETEIETRNESLRQKKKIPVELEEENKNLMALITQTAQIQDRSGLKLKLIQQKKFEDAETTATEAPALIKTLEQTMKAAEKRLSELFQRQESIDEEHKTATEEIRLAEKGLEEKQQEKKALQEWAAQRTPIALLRVNQTAYAGTRIIGRKAQATLKEACSRVMVREVELQGPDGKEYVIRIIR
ncbi:FapA family protein [Desulfobotulus sp. H1]|uniref:FapA family protein n=1 Tax=Desulfobotulus pelophilus TaxID=2823377 RepID=A0ABT3N5X5_9BACT|nr:FapA family protein [Desulfobotulus pelophilus]MCW7752849.1 FapA family protein [Desulfobotulus pelophilus]